MIEKLLRYEWIATRKEGLADCRGIVAKHHEVIHLQKISAENANDRPNFGTAVSELIMGVHFVCRNCFVAQRN